MFSAFRPSDGFIKPEERIAHPGPQAIDLLATNKRFFEEWVDLLSIATRFDFQAVRERAIDVIERRRPRLEPIEQICLGEKHDIPQWLAPAFESLCQRSNPLEIHEAERIGLSNATLLARAREAVRDSARVTISRRPAQAYPTTGSADETQPYETSLVARIVQEVLFPPEPVYLVASPY